jgi:hypothetical protein
MQIAGLLLGVKLETHPFKPCLDILDHLGVLPQIKTLSLFGSGGLNQ